MKKVCAREGGEGFLWLLTGSIHSLPTGMFFNSNPTFSSPPLFLVFLPSSLTYTQQLTDEQVIDVDVTFQLTYAEISFLSCLGSPTQANASLLIRRKVNIQKGAQ